MGVEMLRGVDTERSECAQHDRAVTQTDSWMNWLNLIIGPRWIFPSPDENVKQHKPGYCFIERTLRNVQTLLPIDR